MDQLYIQQINLSLNIYILYYPQQKMLVNSADVQYQTKSSVKILLVKYILVIRQGHSFAIFLLELTFNQADNL